MPTDPVCRKTLDPFNAGATAKFQGHTLYFCSLRCRDEFQRNPGMFVKGATAETKKPGLLKRVFG